MEVLVNFLIEGSSKEYSCILDVAKGTDVVSLISKTLAKAQWTSKKLKVKMVKLWDAGTNQYNDITQSCNSLTVSDKQKYEFVFKNEVGSYIRISQKIVSLISFCEENISKICEQNVIKCCI